jgi:hypothetical protein
MYEPKRKRKILAVVGLLFVVLIPLAMLARSRPVLFSISSDDIASRFKYSIFNPFRNRAPEESAEFFLHLLKNGPCQRAYTLVQEPDERNKYTCEREERHKIKKWYLQYREDIRDTIILNYRTWRQSENKREVYIGEPLLLTLKNQNDQWVITSFVTGY